MPLAELVVTDTIPLPPAKRLRRIKVISTAPLIGEAMRRIHHGESVGELFSSELDLVQEMSLWEERNGGGESDENGGSAGGEADQGPDGMAGDSDGGHPAESRAIRVGEPAARARARVAGSGPA
jgi:ribose phosphate pyrophosphokinase-like protein